MNEELFSIKQRLEGLLGKKVEIDTSVDSSCEGKYQLIAEGNEGLISSITAALVIPQTFSTQVFRLLDGSDFSGEQVLEHLRYCKACLSGLIELIELTDGAYADESPLPSTYPAIDTEALDMVDEGNHSN